ncbi:hypothetical protein FSOLCH5_007595 [Fusarium solani]
MDYQREWQYNAESPACGDYFESICCPCIVYGRANLRLKIASDERDGRDITERQVRLLSSNCCMFASCLPFYGCFISAIRGQVRDFYDIQGDKSRDLAVSCCCPSETLIQTENEIPSSTSQVSKSQRSLVFHWVYPAFTHNLFLEFKLDKSNNHSQHGM